ncbi:MAG TPA: hypothetical protein VIE41_21550 [Methylomirabilota bacterium]|jgi:hypothetical protein
MAWYRSALPQLGEDLFLPDGGIETTQFIGGRCGTDQRHVEQIVAACAPRF